jgi:hypothetical protein
VLTILFPFVEFIGVTEFSRVRFRYFVLPYGTRTKYSRPLVTNVTITFVVIAVVVVTRLLCRHFSPYKSTTTAEQLATFLNSPITEDMLIVPGIGQATARLLKSRAYDKPEFCPITTTFQLLGKFLSLRADGIGSKEQCEAFYVFLKEKGIEENAHNIVKSVAEISNKMIPGMYDDSVYEPIGWKEDHLVHHEPGVRVPLHGATATVPKQG